MEHEKCYFITARTGCNKSSYQDFYRGPYLNKDKAHEDIVKMYKEKSLSSQYSLNGVYHLKEYDYAPIAGMNLILIENQTFSVDKLCDYRDEEFLPQNYLLIDTLK